MYDLRTQKKYRVFKTPEWTNPLFKSIEAKECPEDYFELRCKGWKSGVEQEGFYTISPCGKNHLQYVGVYKSPRNTTKSKLKGLSLGEFTIDTEDEYTFRFHSDDLDKVAEIVGARRKRQVSDEQREAMRKRAAERWGTTPKTVIKLPLNDPKSNVRDV